jgi:NAD-dependent dihydropyrimidine dehydrogenase PreA subunit
VKGIYGKITSGEKHFEGDNFFGKLGGSLQRMAESAINNYDVKINNELCINCGYCYSNCPVDNLFYSDGVKTSGKCIVCMRCVNECPVYAIRILSKKANKAFRQYKGPE